MDSQSFNAWNAYNMAPHQTPVYEPLPDLSQVPSLTGSPASCTYDQFPPQMNQPQIHQEFYTQVVEEPMPYPAYQMPMTPSEFGSDHDTSYCSPPPQLSQHMDQMYAQAANGAGSVERQHTTSGRRRAQNRAAQRAFRERKEKHARDLEVQLAALTDKYNKLESSHEKLRKTIEFLTLESDEGREEDGKTDRRRSSSADTLRKLLDILHGEPRGVGVKSESE